MSELPDDAPAGFRRRKALFLRAVRLAPDRREAFVRRAADGDARLLREVLEMLQTRPGRWTADLAEEVARAAPDRAPRMPETIGRYRVLEFLGQGGMGVVYRAERPDLKNHVALKVCAPRIGLASAEILARFELERRALAAMNHRCIAKLFDAGTTETGQPYFVMELVEGEPLTIACDRRRLDLEERLRLFIELCDGVQHAHSKMVVHRDLKPSNVLVVDEGGALVPKILDFGLAKALDVERFAEFTAVTNLERPLGTLLYMSPEQARSRSGSVDARTDVYALGVVLHEMLTGELPLPAEELERAYQEHGTIGAHRLLAESSPQRPSERVQARRDQEVAVARNMSVASLRSALRGDLDWIVLKALRKEPEQRYAAAMALAEDIGRHLEHLPVAAGPPTLGYRSRKVLRRYRTQVIAIAAVLLTLAAGAFTTARQAIRAEQSNREFDLLSGVVVHERAVAGVEALYPAWPHRIESMQQWLDGDCARLLALRPEIERTVATLRQSTVPRTTQEIEAERRAHPRFREWSQLDAHVRSFRRALALHRGTEELREPTLSPDLLELSPGAQNDAAWARVAMLQERQVYGEEALGLALARCSVARSVGTAQVANRLDTLAWALLANGRLEEARTAMATSLAASDPDTSAWRVRKELFEAAARELLTGTTQLEAKLEEVTGVVDSARSHRFAADSAGFLHDTLVRLLGQIESLAAEERTAVEERLEWARRISDATMHHPGAGADWAEVRAAVAAADDVRASRLYAGKQIDLSAEVVMGLVPIGMNPVTRLWEFYDLRSASDGTCDPREIPVPRHSADGSIEVTDATGIVFVLLPGGTFLMGAQAADPAAANFDPAADEIEVPNAVTLSPFFLARHELTQGQWARLWNGEDSLRRPSQFRVGIFEKRSSGSQWAGTDADGAPVSLHFSNDLIRGEGVQHITLAHPVERVDWSSCVRVLQQHGMSLPTEAQWEYACRAQTATPWSCDESELPSHARLYESVREDAGVSLRVPARVGSLRANAFGLHDMHGNVGEWCLDWVLLYSTSPQPDSGLRMPIDAVAEYQATSGSNPVEYGKVVRGGSFMQYTAYSRASARWSVLPGARHEYVGARAARPAWRSTR